VPTCESNAPPLPAVPVQACQLDPVLEERLKTLLKLAGAVCGVPGGAINLLDVDGRRLKIDAGPIGIEAPFDSRLCAVTISNDGLFQVPDLRDDPRFSGSALLTAQPSFRFYAGYPLRANNGHSMGCLCIYDNSPRHLTAIQQETLATVAGQIAALIELKLQTAALSATIERLNRRTRALEVSDSTLRALFDASPVAAFVKDEAGRMAYCNPALCAPFGVLPADWIGKTDFETMPREIAEKFRSIDLQVLEEDRLIHFEDLTLAPDGHTVIWDVHKYPLVDVCGNRYVACTALDVTKQRVAEQEVQQVHKELHLANERLRTLSLTDPLTGLMNRRALEKCLERELARCKRSQAQLCLLMIDVDNFKTFNDSYGHVQGDEVLRSISALMQEWTRKGDMIARYGGEEFLVILPDTCAIEALQIANRLCESVADAAWEYRAITISIGVANLDNRVLTMSSFLNEVDEALYAAKHAGKNRVHAAPGNHENTNPIAALKQAEGALQ